MKDLYYFAAWTDSDCLCGCDHQHNTLISAVACNAPCAGGYVIAVEKGKYRALNDAEEIEFQRLKYGFEPKNTQPERSKVPGISGILIRPETKPG